MKIILSEEQIGQAIANYVNKKYPESKNSDIYTVIKSQWVSHNKVEMRAEIEFKEKKKNE